jgi:hypothetical protein
MRVMGIVTSLVVFGFFLYAAVSFMIVSAAINPTQAYKPKSPPLPLEKAAPEIARLKDGLVNIIPTARQMTPLCPNRDVESDPARPRGKMLVWDLGKGDVSDAHGRLPAEMRIQSLDEPFTIYLITERERRSVMNYNFDFFHGGGSTGVQGFRTDLAVCAVDWPSRKPRGRYWINGNGPPMYVEYKPGMKEVDEDWAGNLGRWLETCVKGPEARYYTKYQQCLVKKADAAREVVDQCEMLGSLPVLANLPKEAAIWNPQTDRWHPAHGYIRNKGDDQAEKSLMVMVLDDEYVPVGSTKGRFDYRVALVAFPGTKALGVYQVRGVEWPLPTKPNETWAEKGDPCKNLSTWVEQICQNGNKRGLPATTIPVAHDATQLANTEWLKGPGWLKHMKGTEAPAEQKGWEQMAEECSPKIAACRAKGPAVPQDKLPKKIVVWNDYADVFNSHPAHKSLPKPLQAGPNDREVLMAVIVNCDYVQEPKDKPKTERFDHEIALFAMPGARPIGVYRCRGESLDWNRDKHGPNAKSHDIPKDIADWLAKFVASPETVARNSAVK